LIAFDQQRLGFGIPPLTGQACAQKSLRLEKTPIVLVPLFPDRQRLAQEYFRLRIFALPRQILPEQFAYIGRICLLVAA